MKVTPRLLRKIAFWSVAAPACGTLMAQLVIWIIPGCNPNPYALGVCSVASVNLAAPLLLAAIGGLYLAFVALVLVVFPLLILAWLLGARSRKNAPHAG